MVRNIFVPYLCQLFRRNDMGHALTLITFFSNFLSIAIAYSMELWNRLYKCWLTPTDRATRCFPPSRHRAVQKAGRWVWSTGDGHRSSVDNTWQRSPRRREIILSLEVGESSTGNCAYFLEISDFCICLINILQLLGALSHRPKNFGSSKNTAPDTMH